MILVLLMGSLKSKAQQSFGFGIGAASTSSLLFDIKYYINKNAFSIGYTYELNESKGKLIKNQLKNHGREVSGRGDFFTSVDIGYTRILLERVFLSAEVSIGHIQSFTNYIDGRFTGGGYHMIDHSEESVGYGGKMAYFITSNIGIYSGYNTIRKASVGLDFKF